MFIEHRWREKISSINENNWKWCVTRHWYTSVSQSALRILLRILIQWFANKRAKKWNQTRGKIAPHRALSKRKSWRPRCSKRTGENEAKTCTIKTEVNTRQYMWPETDADVYFERTDCYFIIGLFATFCMSF